MERVKKREVYWFVNEACEASFATDNRWEENDIDYEVGNYFHTEEQAEAMARKIRAVLKGADVIEMPSKKEI